MKKTIIYGLTAGLIATVVMVIWMARVDNTDSLGGMLFGYTTMLVAFSLIFVGIKDYRERNGGVISFGKAFKIGLAISLIASTMYVLGWMIEYYAFIPDFYDKCEVHQVAKLKAAGAAPAIIQATAQQYEQYKQMARNPLVLALGTYLVILPVGLIVSLLAAAILKRKANPAQIAMN
jgi:hypothetical protein